MAAAASLPCILTSDARAALKAVLANKSDRCHACRLLPRPPASKLRSAPMTDWRHLVPDEKRLWTSVLTPETDMAMDQYTYQLIKLDGEWRISNKFYVDQ